MAKERRAAGFLADPGRFDARSAFRLVVGLILVLIAILAVLALLNSFFVQPKPNQPSSPNQSPSGPDRGGGGGKSCDDVVKFFLWTFVGLGALDLVFWGLAIAFREKNRGNVATSIWGILGLIGFFLTLLALAAWRLMDLICHASPDCTGFVDGAYTTFMFLLVLTIAPLGLGIYFSHKRRKNFFATGWGIVGVVLFVPSALTGFFWYLVRFACNLKNLNCGIRQHFLDYLSSIFWWSLLVAVACVAIGIYVQKRYKHGIWRSGWAVLAILALVLASMAGLGWRQVNDIYIPICDPPRDDTPPTCAQLKQDLQQRLGITFLVLAGLALAAMGTAIYLRRDAPKTAFKHWGAIAAYILLAVAIVVGLLWLLAGSMCGEGDGDERGQGSGNGGQGDPGNGGGSGGGGGGGGGSGGGGGGIGGGGGGGGSGGGSGGGGGGIGSGAPVTIAFNPVALTWVLVALGVLLVLGLLAYLLKRRKDEDLLKGGPTPSPPDAVQASERQQLMQLLDRGTLNSADAVIAAYRAFLSWCEARGFQKEPTETPFEHGRRVQSTYPVPREAMDDFVRAYEIARLSSREPTPEERARAVRFSRDIAAPPATPPPVKPGGP